MALNKNIFDGMVIRLEKICCKLAEIKDILSGDITVNTNSVITNTCDNPVPVYFCPTTAPTLDPEVVCLSNDNGLTIVKGWEVFSILNNTVTSTLYIGGIAVTGYQVVPCDKPTPYDYEKENICVDGKSWTKWFVWDKTGDGLPNLITVLWLDDTDTVVAAPDLSLINNANCKVCSPTIESFNGNTSTLTEFNSIWVDIPSCCEVTITTSAGTITLPPKQDNWVYTQSWDCFVSSYSISSTCDINNIFTILQKTK